MVVAPAAVVIALFYVLCILGAVVVALFYDLRIMHLGVEELGGEILQHRGKILEYRDVHDARRFARSRHAAPSRASLPSTVKAVPPPPWWFLALGSDGRASATVVVALVALFYNLRIVQ